MSTAWASPRHILTVRHASCCMQAGTTGPWHAALLLGGALLECNMIPCIEITAAAATAQAPVVQHL